MSRKKIIVIGSGFGGLSAAIRLAASGNDVTIYEKLDQWGGRAYQHSINGFKFDGGPTVITAPHQFDELFRCAGKSRHDYFDLTPLDPFYRVFRGDGEYFNYYRDSERAADEVARFSPGDVDGYARFIQGTKDIFQWFHPFTERTFPTFSSFAKIFPHVLTTGTWRTMYGYAAHFVKDDFIRQVCSFHPLLVGGNPFDTPSIYGLIIQFEKEWGVHYATGGTGAIVNALGKLFLECGGKIHFNTPVEGIAMDRQKVKGVRLPDGSVDQADVVVSNADVAYTYQNLIPGDRVPPLTAARLNTMEYSNSLVVHYFGTDKEYLDSPLLHHNLILDDDYQELMRDVFRRKRLTQRLGLYVHMPSRTDSSISPAGCGSFYALSLVPNLDGRIDWEERISEHTDSVMGYLESKYLPGLRSSIVAQHVVTPLHFKHTLNSFKGAAFGPKPSMVQSGFFRPQVQSKVFENLYFVGAGVHPGAGVPAVLASGKIAATMICPEYREQFVTAGLELALR